MKLLTFDGPKKPPTTSPLMQRLERVIELYPEAAVTLENFAAQLLRRSGADDDHDDEEGGA